MVHKVLQELFFVGNMTMGLGAWNVFFLTKFTPDSVKTLVASPQKRVQQMGICIPKSKTRTPFTIRDPKIHETQKACFFSLRHCDLNRMSSAQWVFFSGLFFVQICPKFLDFFQQRQWLNSDTPHFPVFFFLFLEARISQHGCGWCYFLANMELLGSIESSNCWKTMFRNCYV